MFALAGAALAMVHTAKPSKRKVIAGIMGSAALVAFVTEPLEFSFMFEAYGVLHYFLSCFVIVVGTCTPLVGGRRRDVRHEQRPGRPAR